MRIRLRMSDMKIRLIIPILCFLSSCTLNHVHPDEFVIHGQLKNFTPGKIYLEEVDISDIRRIDSALIGNEGKFTFTGKPLDQGFYLLKLQDGQSINLLLQKNETISITGDYKKLPKVYLISGSPGSLLLKDFYHHSNKNRALADSLTDLLHKHQFDDDYYQLTLTYDDLFGKIWEDQKSFERNFIDQHQGSLATLLVLNYAFGPRPVLSEQDDWSFYKKVDSILMKKFPSNKHVLYHHKRVMRMQSQK
ncbi:MAG: DUF4369 domain-containing protein [Bacteroidetes bacterium]|nr:DUF4369 domain-containing protein [Bacteroidota bacterium]